MVRLGTPEYGVTECTRTCNIVKITATYEKILEVDVDEDFDEAVMSAIDDITLEDLDYDWEEVGEETELVYVKGGLK